MNWIELCGQKVIRKEIQRTFKRLGLVYSRTPKPIHRCESKSYVLQADLHLLGWTLSLSGRNDFSVNGKIIMKPLINPKLTSLRSNQLRSLHAVSDAYRFIFLWFKFANVRFAPQAPDNQEAIDGKAGFTSPLPTKLHKSFNYLQSFCVHDRSCALAFRLSSSQGLLVSPHLI